MPHMMNITVKSLQGDEYLVCVSDDQLVSHLKASISEKAGGLPVERQKLVYKGRTMLDRNLLREYNLEDGCRVHLILQKEGSSNLDNPPEESRNMSCPIGYPDLSNQAQTNDHHDYHKSAQAPGTATTTTTRPQSKFEIILRERLAKHFSPPAVEKIMANLQHEINADINSSSLDDLERLAKQKLNISNE